MRAFECLGLGMIRAVDLPINVGSPPLSHSLRAFGIRYDLNYQEARKQRAQVGTVIVNMNIVR